MSLQPARSGQPAILQQLLPHLMMNSQAHASKAAAPPIGTQDSLPTSQASHQTPTARPAQPAPDAAAQVARPAAGQATQGAARTAQAASAAAVQAAQSAAQTRDPLPAPSSRVPTPNGGNLLHCLDAAEVLVQPYCHSAGGAEGSDGCVPSLGLGTLQWAGEWSLHALGEASE